MRWIVIMLACVLVSGCPRTADVAAGRSQAARATHPWEVPGWKPPVPIAGQSASAEAQGTGGKITFPGQSGPALPDTDSFDTTLLPGAWLLVCVARDEELELLDIPRQDILELSRGGQCAYHHFAEGKDNLTQGSWSKMDVGVLGIAFERGEQTPFYGQLFEKDFLYLWSYRNATGLWFARIPESGANRLTVNRFDTSRGLLKITQNMGTNYAGSVSGTGQLDVSGYFARGILSMRWSDAKNNSAGFAVFIASPDMATIHGTWWLKDLRAAPFGGTWDGTKTG